MKIEQSEKFNLGLEKSLSSKDNKTSNNREHSLLTEIVKSTDECSKISAPLEDEYPNKEPAKAALKALSHLPAGICL